MKEMIVEKQVDLHQAYADIIELNCKCDCSYSADDEGVRALGQINIKGLGVKDDAFHDINENIELDIFAPIEKLKTNLFEIHLKDFDYELDKDCINLKLYFMLNGLLQEDEFEKEDVLEFEDDEEIIIDDIVDEHEDAATIEDLLNDDENIKVSQKYVVAQKNDTYATIAQRYNVNEKDLMITNQYKIVEFKSLVLLP